MRNRYRLEGILSLLRCMEFKFDRRRTVQLASIAAGLVLLLQLIAFLLAEGFWFQEVNYLSVFVTRWSLQGLVALVSFTISFSFLWRHLTIARRQAWQSAKVEPLLPGNIRFSLLLPIVLLLSFLISASLVYHGEMAVSHWQPNLSLQRSNLPVPPKFDLIGLWNLMQGWQMQLWQLFLAAGLMIAILIYARVLLRAIALLASFSFAIVLSRYWDKLLLAWYQPEFGQVDPLLHRELGFYIFSLPIWELLRFWLTGLIGLAFLSVSLIYLISADSLSQGQFPGFSIPQFRHLCRLGGWLMLIVSFSYWLDRYLLLYSSDGVTYGASYTNTLIELPVYTGLSLMALPIALWFFSQGLGLGERKLTQQGQKTEIHRRFTTPYSRRSQVQTMIQQAEPTDRLYKRPTQTQHYPPSLSRLLIVVGFYLLAILSLSQILPIATQQLVVQPNELRLEQPYIQRTIALTRQGFELNSVNAQTFDPDDGLTLEAIQRNDSTIKNIRLWDRRPLLETNRQLQRIRLYYEFPDADVDRYALPTEDGRTIQQQVLIAARELDYNAVPAAAQTWVNQHLIYTHGYGFTVSPVNRVGEGGLPDYLIRGIETSPDARIRNSIPIGKPRIYYGEITDTYVMTQTQAQELDYPSGSDNVYNTYDGRGGVSIGSWGRKLLYAKYLQDWRMLLTDNFTPQTKLLFRRNISQRVQTIAPFLHYDSNPYLVAVDTGNKQWEHNYQPTGATATDESYLYWMIDAYTTSDRYPYSDPLGNDFNYIRNSVKVVVDAYHGSVNFYIADPQDPMIQAWNKIFPNMFQPLAAMPLALQQHIRYPQDLLQVQSNQLMTYHMTDPVVFYNREDQWRAPNEIYGSEQQVVEPYYLITKLPIGSGEEFILLRPFTPAQRNNLIAWMAARSDGEDYGKILLYTFPKQELVFGPEQIEARINQDPIISERISLWNRQGSRVIQGNLLVVPIERSLLYVEPLYLVAEQTQLPTLVRVVVAYGSRIAMAETLEGAINAIFTASPTAETPILRTTDAVPAL